MVSFKEFISEGQEYKFVAASKSQKMPSGNEIVGWTMVGDNFKYKGVNILRDKETGKFFAAGSTAKTKSTKVFGSPQEAAKAYHENKSG